MSDLSLNILMKATDVNTSSVFGSLKSGIGNIVFGMKNLSTEGNIGVGALTQGMSVLGGVFAKVALGAAVAGAGVAVGIGVASVKAAADYEQSMNKVQALTGSSKQAMQQYDQSVKSLAVNAGVAPKALADGLYNVLSASYTGATAMNVLTLATQDSKIGMTDAATTTDALTNILRSFGVQNKDITRTNGEMLETVTLGKATFEQYATTIVKSASASTQFHISMETMNAAWSTMTSSGIRAAQASTDYQASLKVMYGNIGTVTSSLHKNGIAFNETKFNAMSYGDKVQYLNAALQEANNKHVKVTGVTIQAAQAIQTISQHIGDYNSNLAKLSDKQAMAQKTQQAWSITQSGFNQTMDRVKASLDVLLINIGQQLLPRLTELAQNIAPIVMAFADWITKSGIVQNAMNDLVGAITTVITVGSQIIAFFQHNQAAMDGLYGVLITVAGFIATSMVMAFYAWAASMVPIVVGAATIIGPLLLVAAVVAGVILAIQHWTQITAFLQGVLASCESTVQRVFAQVQQTVSGVIGGVITWFHQWQDVIIGVASVLGVFFGPALIKAGVQAVQSGIQIVRSFVGSLAETGTAAVVNGAKTSVSFVQSMIQSGTAAVVNGAKVTAQFVGSLIKTGVEAVINGAKVTVSFVKSLIQTGIEGWASAGKLATFIGSLIASGAQAVLNGAKIAVSFVGSMITAGAQAVASGARIAASFIVSIVQAGAASIVAGAQMIAALVPAFLSWAAGAAAAAVATIAATWPVLAIIAAIALLALGIYELVTHWKQVVTFVQGIWVAFSSWLVTALNAVKTFFIKIWDDIIAFLQSAWNVIVNIAKVAALLLLTVILGPIVLLVALIITHWSQIIAFLKSAWATILADVKSAWQAITSAFSNAWSGISSALASLWSGISGWFNNLISQAGQFGARFVQMLASGITGAAGAVVNAVSGVANKIKSFLGFHSPTEQGPASDSDAWGPNFVKMFASGVVATLPQITDAATQVATAMEPMYGHRGTHHTGTHHGTTHHKAPSTTYTGPNVGTGMANLFNADLSSNHNAAQKILTSLTQAIQADSENVLKLHVAGNKVAEANLRKKLSMEDAQFRLYKDLLKQHGDKLKGDTIQFLGMGPVKAPGTSGNSTGLSGGSSGSSGSGNYYVTINNVFNVPRGTDRQHAKYMADMVEQELTNRFRQQGSYTTTSSGTNG